MRQPSFINILCVSYLLMLVSEKNVKRLEEVFLQFAEKYFYPLNS